MLRTVRQFGSVRWLWNRALDMKSTAWKEHKENLSCYTIKAMLPQWKEEFQVSHERKVQAVAVEVGSSSLSLKDLPA